MAIQYFKKVHTRILNSMWRRQYWHIRKRILHVYYNSLLTKYIVTSQYKMYQNAPSKRNDSRYYICHCIPQYLTILLSSLKYFFIFFLTKILKCVIFEIFIISVICWLDYKPKKWRLVMFNFFYSMKLNVLYTCDVPRETERLLYYLFDTDIYERVLTCNSHSHVFEISLEHIENIFRVFFFVS